jgi:hypothetical protein
MFRIAARMHMFALLAFASTGLCACGALVGIDFGAFHEDENDATVLPEDGIEPGDEIPSGGPDAKDGISPPIEAGPDAPLPTLCDPATGTFGPKQYFPAPINTATFDDGSGQFNPALTTLYFSSNRTGGACHSFSVSRPSPTGAWGSASQLTGFGLVNRDDCNPFISDDESTVYFDSTSLDGGFLTGDIYKAVRGGASGPFGPASVVTGVNSPSAADVEPWVTPSGVLYFTSTRQASKLPAVYAATPSGGGFTVAAVTGLNGNASSAVLTGDELTIYYAAEPGTVEGQDVWVATRKTKLDPFGSPRVVSELSAANSSDFPAWISPDGCKILVASDEHGTLDVFYAERTP